MSLLRKASLLVGATLLFAGCGAAATQQNGSSSSTPSFDTKQEIHVVTRESGSGTRGAFSELVELEEKNADGSKKDLLTQTANVENNTNSVLSTIQSDKYAIGYVSMGSLNDSVKTLQIDGVDATPENVKNGKYVLSRSFYVATKPSPNAVTQDFLKFVLSKEGQEIVGKSYIATNDSAEAYQPSDVSGKIVIGGSSSVSPLMEKLVEAYKALNSNVDIELQVSDSTTGLTQATAGVYDIGMSSRSLKDSEKATLEATEIALDGIAVIVHKENTLTSLSKAQLKAIYTGEVTQWENAAK